MWWKWRRISEFQKRRIELIDTQEMIDMLVDSTRAAQKKNKPRQNEIKTLVWVSVVIIVDGSVLLPRLVRRAPGFVYCTSSLEIQYNTKYRVNPPTPPHPTPFFHLFSTGLERERDFLSWIIWWWSAERISLRISRSDHPTFSQIWSFYDNKYYWGASVCGHEIWKNAPTPDRRPSP